MCDGKTNEVLYEESSTASPFATRPLFLVMGKENHDNMADIQTALRERQDVSFRTQFGDRELGWEWKHLLMIDGKMRSLLTGLSGAFYLLCKEDS